VSEVPASQPERFRDRAKGVVSVLRAAKASKGLLGAVLNIAGLVGLVTSVFNLVKGGDASQAVLAGALAVIAIGMGFMVYALQVQLERDRIDARGAVALRAANDPLAKSANALAFATSSLLNGKDPGIFEAQAHEFAVELAGAYTLITGARCRVTVKQTYDVEASQDLAVRTLFTSDSQFLAASQSGVDLVKENTDFSELLNKAESFWLSDDVASMPGYINSHYTREEIASGRMSYRSVLVWPVRVVTATDATGSDVDLLGFLCVDSPETGIFDKRRDVSPGQILAHSLYPSLRLYKQRTQIREAPSPA